MSFPMYPEYRDSGVNWIGNVPKHWNIKPLKWLAEQVTEKAIASSFQVGLENIEGWSGRFIETEGDFSGDGIEFRPEDILFGKLRPYLAKAWLSDKAGQAVGDFFVLRPNAIHGEFLHKYILTPTVIDNLNSSTIGAKMPRVGWEDMAVLAVALPPREEQAQIARFLDHETARIDALIEEQQRLIELLKEKRQAVISNAVTKGLDPMVPMKDSGVEWLGEVPAHWAVSPLKFLVEEKVAGPYGASLTKAMYTDSGYRVYGQQQVISDDFSIGDYYISEEKFSEMQRYIVFPGDVLVSVMGTIGRVSVVPVGVEVGIINPRLVRYKFASSKVIPEFVKMLLMSLRYQSRLREESQGSTMEGLNMVILGDLPLVLPPLDAQHPIVAFVKNYDSSFKKLVSQATSAVGLLQERRSALISAAVTGKIDVRGWQPSVSATSLELAKEAV
nr:restriction endonuclease subunit S [uncultured Pseudomonas sp.]